MIVIIQFPIWLSRSMKIILDSTILNIPHMKIKWIIKKAAISWKVSERKNASHFNITYSGIKTFLLTTRDFTNSIFKAVKLSSTLFIFWNSPLLLGFLLQNQNSCNNLTYWNVNKSRHSFLGISEQDVIS